MWKIRLTDHFTPRCDAVCGAAGVCPAAAFTDGGDRARQGPQPRRRIGVGGGTGSGRTRHPGPRRLLPKGGRRGVVAARRPAGVRVQFASCAAAVQRGRLRARCAQSPRRHRQLPRGSLAVEQPLFDRTNRGECSSRVDRAGDGGHRQTARRPGADVGGHRRVWPRADRRRDCSFRGSHGRDRAGRTASWPSTAATPVG